MQPGQEKERARWLLVGAIAQEYPELMEPLARVRSEWDACRVEVGSGVLLFLRVRLYSFPSLFKAGWEWALKAYLIPVIPRQYTRYPLSSRDDAYHYKWALDIAITLVSDDNCRAAPTVQAACRDRTDPFWLGIHPTLDDSEPPASPELSLDLALNSRQEFLKESVKALEEYADKVQDWYQRSGYGPVPDRREEEKHFRWAAWRVVEALPAEDIAAREARRCEADDPLDADWIEKRVGRITRLIGIVKKP